jgi:phytoene dehydrogenase-like protein
MAERLDALVVGAGPNGLAAAIALAAAGRSVRVLEAAAVAGGGTRSAELTLPGFRHDVCSAIHPLALASPFLRFLPLAEHGLAFAHPELPLAHPFDDGSAAILARSVDETAVGLGADADAYRGLIGPLAARWEQLVDDLLAPPRAPRHPRTLVRFARTGLRSATHVARARFGTDRARALFAGCAAHSMQPLDGAGTAAFALVLLTLGHACGWPAAAGGSQTIADAMVAHLRSLGGEVETEHHVTRLRELPPSRAVLLDLTPRQVVAVARDELPARYLRALGRYRYGPAVFKLDYALDAPVQWTSPACNRAGTVHLGGTLEEIAASEAEVARGRVPALPFVLVAQQSLFDRGRAPGVAHTLWAYCHVPNGSAADMRDAVERQIERFAPGFRALVRQRSVMGPAAMEAHDANFVGGDINGGAADLRQALIRPVLRRVPYTTPNPGVLICSSSTPPGGGVHGMCGYHAARAALRGALR